MKYRYLFLLFLSSFLQTTIVAQENTKDRASINNINAIYRLKGSSGLTEAAFRILATLTVSRNQNSSQLFLSISAVQSTTDNPSPSFLYSYKYEGVEYGDQHVGKDAFRGIKANNPQFDVIVQGPNLNYSGKGLDGIHNPVGNNLPKDIDAREYSVYIEVGSVSLFTGTSTIENKIRQLISFQKSKDLVEEADRLVESEKYSEAREKMRLALYQTPSDNNLKEKLKRIDELEEKQKKVTQEKTQKEKANQIKTTETQGTNTANRTSNSNSSPANTQPSEADKKFEDEWAKAQKMLSDAEEKRKAEEDISRQRVEEGSKVIGNIVDGFMANSQKNFEKRADEWRRMREEKEENEQKSKLLLEIFSQDAERGNEQAIAKVAEAYYILEKPEGYFYKIEEGYSSVQWKQSFYSDEPEKYVGFLRKMYSQFKSPVANKLLTSYYSEIVKAHQACGHTDRKKAVSRTVWGLIFGVGVGYFGSQYILNNDNILKDQQGLKDAVYYTAGVGGMLGGGVLLISGLVHASWAGQYRKNAEYINANRNLGELNSRTRLTFSPNYNIQTNSVGFTARLSF